MFFAGDIAPRERGETANGRKNEKSEGGSAETLSQNQNASFCTTQRFRRYTENCHLEKQFAWTNTGFPDILDVHFEMKAMKGGQASCATHSTPSTVYFGMHKRKHITRAGVRMNQPIV